MIRTFLCIQEMSFSSSATEKKEKGHKEKFVLEEFNYTLTGCWTENEGLILIKEMEGNLNL